MGVPWIQTVTGRQFNLLEPRPEQVAIEDIAHALSNLCRYAGQTKRFYSVGQHSLLVADTLAVQYPHEPLLELRGLLHDGSEAYIIDIPRPLKVHLPGYAPFEARAQRVVYQAFGLPFDDQEAEEQVHEADRYVVAIEAHSFMGDVSAWNIPAYTGKLLESWPPEMAKQRFLDRFLDIRRALGRHG